MSSKKPIFPIVIILIVFLPSFMMSKNFTDPFIIPKNFYFYFFVSAFFGIFALWSFNRKYQTVISISLLDLGLLLYIVYQFFQLTFTKAVSYSNDSFLVLLTSVVLYFCIKPWLVFNEANKSSIGYLIGGFLLIGIAQSVFGFLQLNGLLPTLQKQFQIPGAYGNPGPYSNFIVVMLPFALASFLYAEKKSFRTYSLIALVIILLILPFTRARAAWIATVICLGYILYFRFEMNKAINKWFGSLWIKLSAFAVIVVVLCIVAVYLFKFKEESASGRLFIWKVTTQMIKDKPLVGFGYDSFSAAHNNYQARYFALHPNADKEAALADGVNYAFNEYLQTTAETGIIGLAILLVLLVFSFYKTNIIRNEKDGQVNYLMLAAKASLIAIWITALFSYPLRSVPNNVFFIVMLAGVSANTPIELKSIKLKEKDRKLLSIFGLILLAFFVYNQVGKYKATKEWLTAFHLVREGRNEEAVRLYEKLYPTLNYNQYFLFNYGAELSVMGYYVKSVEILKETEPRLNDSDLYIYLGNSYEGSGDIANALKCFQQASLIMPLKYFPRYRLAQIYLKMGKTQQAVSLAKYILQMPVKIPSDIITNIRNEMQELVNKN
jgi:O-antigen polymerase